jgi:hypothetical protein
MQALSHPAPVASKANTFYWRLRPPPVNLNIPQLPSLLRIKKALRCLWSRSRK